MKLKAALTGFHIRVAAKKRAFECCDILPSLVCFIVGNAFPEVLSDILGDVRAYDYLLG